MTPRPLFALALILILSVPIYVWGIWYPLDVLPFDLPGSAVMVVIPALVASVLIYREKGMAAVAALWRRIFDVDRIRNVSWAMAALLTMPAAATAAYVAMRALHLPLPDQPSVDIALIPTALLFYFAGVALEEVGWTGYCTEPLQQRFGILIAGAIIGGVWAIWHLVPWIVIKGHTLYWTAGETALTVLMRIVMGYIYAHGGKSLFLATLFHATINVSFSLFPNAGSHYDPAILAAVLAAGMVTFASMNRALHAGRRTR